MHSTAKRQTWLNTLMLGHTHQLCTELTVHIQVQGLCQLGHFPNRPAALTPPTLVKPLNMSRPQARSTSTILEQARLQVVWQLLQQVQEQVLKDIPRHRRPPWVLKAQARTTRTGSG